MPKAKNRMGIMKAVIKTSAKEEERVKLIPALLTLSPLTDQSVAQQFHLQIQQRGNPAQES